MTEEQSIPANLIHDLALQLYFNRRIHPPLSRAECGESISWREDIITWREMPQAQKVDWINKANRFLVAWFARYPNHKDFVMNNWQCVYNKE